MRRHRAMLVILGVMLVGCARAAIPTSVVPGPDAPFPPTWTPGAVGESTPTATLVVRPTPTWDGTPPPPSEAEIPRVSPARLHRGLESGEHIAVDVRNLAAFNQARIGDALHVPLEELSERVGELDGNKVIVFYDLSPNDFASLAAAMELYGLGFTKVAVLEGGLQRWYSDGYPIEGTLLTPTPGPAGPPWTVTPLATSTAMPTLTRTVTPISATGTVTPTATKAQ